MSDAFNISKEKFTTPLRIEAEQVSKAAVEDDWVLPENYAIASDAKPKRRFLPFRVYRFATGLFLAAAFCRLAARRVRRGYSLQVHSRPRQHYLHTNPKHHRNYLYQPTATYGF